MNYSGLEALRSNVAAFSNAMCDVMLNRLESQRRPDTSTLAKRLTAQTLRRIPVMSGRIPSGCNRTPETVRVWYSRWRDELDASELANLFWRWQTRFGSLRELDWLRYRDAPLYEALLEIHFIVPETHESVRAAERWLVPNKLELQSKQKDSVISLN